MSSKILVLDDEKEIADVIALYLRNDGYEVETAYSGREALGLIEKGEPDLALLDVMLPDIDGFRILQKIREKYRFPVIMLTAKTEYTDKIAGLTLGADDYIAKPFNPLELVARCPRISSLSPSFPRPAIIFTLSSTGPGTAKIRCIFSIRWTRPTCWR